jgi:hypothetical protein
MYMGLIILGRQAHTVDLLVPEPIEKLERSKSPGIDHIPEV